MSLIENTRYSVSIDTNTNTGTYSSSPNSYDDRIMYYINNDGVNIDETITIIPEK